MKNIHVVALACIGSVFATTSACTSLLGDFEVVASPVDAGAATDVAVPVADAPSETAPVDSGVDAGNDYAQLRCAEIAGSKRKVGALQSNPNSMNNAVNGVWLTAYTPPTAGARTRMVALVPDLFGVVHAYLYDADGGGGTVKDLPIPVNGQMLSAKRYPGGTAVLMLRQVASVTDGSTTPSPANVLDIVKLADEGTAWSMPVRAVSEVDLGGTNGNCVQRVVGGLNVRDAATDDYDVVFSFQESQFIFGQGCAAGNPQLKAVHLNGARGGKVQTWPLPGGVRAVDIPDDGIVIGSTTAVVMVNPSPNGTPPPGLAAFIVAADSQSLAHQAALAVPLKDPQDFVLAAGMKAQPAGDKFGVAFIEANLGNASSKPTFYVGSVPAGKLGGINPSTQLAGSELAGLTDLPVDKASYHWESYVTQQSVTHNFLAIARAYPSAHGFNFIWWDGKGRIRAQRTTNSPGGTLVRPAGTGVSMAAAITFRQPPSVQLASMQIAWVEDSGSAGGLEVLSMEIACTP